MPEMDGITALKEIKKINPNAKIIMCSAMGQQAMVIDAIQAGAKDFIVKPFQADRVLEAISKTLSLRRLMIRRCRMLKKMQFCFIWSFFMFLYLGFNIKLMQSN